METPKKLTLTSQTKKQQIIALGRLKWPLRRIEAETGIRRETASKYLKEAGIGIRPPGRGGHDPPAVEAKAAKEVTPDSAAKAAKEVTPDSEATDEEVVEELDKKITSAINILSKGKGKKGLPAGRQVC